MQQFNLDTWLQDKSLKVVTRDGKPVRIVCWDRPGFYPIIGYTEDELNLCFSTTKSGFYCKDGAHSQNDLFFADEEEEPQSTEIQFGAFDSEFIKDEYYIPEGCEARIEGNKVIIERVQKNLNILL